jgi:hypothetical protein
MYELIILRDEIEVVQKQNIETDETAKRKSNISDTPCIYTIFENSKGSTTRQQTVKKVHDFILDIQGREGDLCPVTRFLVETFFPHYFDLLREQFVKVGVSSGGDKIVERYSSILSKCNFQRFEIDCEADNKCRLAIEKGILEEISSQKVAIRVSGYSGKFECFQMFQNGECTIPRIQRLIKAHLKANKQRKKVKQPAIRKSKRKAVEEEEEEEGEEEEEEGEGEEEEEEEEGEGKEEEEEEGKEEVESNLLSTQSQRCLMDNLIAGLGEVERCEARDLFAAIHFLHEKLCCNKVDILWIGCNNFDVIQRVLRYCEQSSLVCHISLVERENIEVPFNMINYVTFFNEEFLFFKCRNLFDFIYNSVNGSASSVFNLKLLCCCHLYHKPHLLLLSHELLFHQKRSLKDQSTNKEEKHLFSKRERTEIQSFKRAEYKYLFRNTMYWWREKSYYIKVSKLLFEINCIPRCTFIKTHVFF